MKESTPMLSAYMHKYTNLPRGFSQGGGANLVAGAPQEIEVFPVEVRVKSTPLPLGRTPLGAWRCTPGGSTEDKQIRDRKPTTWRKYECGSCRGSLGLLSPEPQPLEPDGLIALVLDVLARHERVEGVPVERPHTLLRTPP